MTSRFELTPKRVLQMPVANIYFETLTGKATLVTPCFYTACKLGAVGHGKYSYLSVYKNESDD